MKSRCSVALVALAAGAMPLAVSAQTVLHDQPAASPLITQAPFANVNENFSGQLIAENFTLGDEALVGSVEWWGTSANGITGQEAGLTNLAGFRIQIFAADGLSTTGAPDMPGTLIAEHDFALTEILATPGEPGPYFGGPTFHFNAAFPSPIALGAGAYWVAINAIVVDANSTNIFIWFAEPFGNTTGDGVYAEEGRTSPRDGVWRKVGSGAALEPGFRIISVDAVDTDGDGLLDDDELQVHGTDPNDPDTDGDGLTDGTEVDLAGSGSCVSPLDADSDNDGLLDGVEAVMGTSPCSMDTDGDGIFDPIDADPLIPHASGDLEDAIRSVALQIDALPLDSMLAPNGNAAVGRRNSMSSRMHNAANSIANNKKAAALALLSSVYDLVDGDPGQKDWVSEADPQKAVLAMYIASLMQVVSQ